jgi:PKD repeat protein
VQNINKLGLRAMRWLLCSVLIAVLAACGAAAEREPVVGTEVVTPPVTTTVANQVPVGSFIATSNGLTVTFNASASRDPDGTILGYQWNFGDGTTVLNTTSATVTHVFANSGTFMVNLIVLDSQGTVSSVVSQNITIAPIPLVNQAPTARFTAANVDTTAAVNATISTDPDGTITSYAWNFGEPTSSINTATGNSATHVYGRTGSFVVTLTVTDNGGLTALSTQTVIISSLPNANPVPQYSFVRDALLVTFNGALSTDSDGTITQYAWNFGEPTSATNTATGVTTTHAYRFAGSYTVTLTVTDNKGAVASSAAAWTFSPPAAVATGVLNDTGITASQCYQAGTDTFVLCSSALAIGTVGLSVTTFAPQDGMTGRDADANTNTAIDGALGFSFTKIGASGETLPATATQWSCIKDNVTGLMWENKTNGGGLHNKGNIFTNYDSTTAAQLPNGAIPNSSDIAALTNSIGFRNAVNAQGLCGATDWRLPEGNELRSIWNYGAVNNFGIDPAWFNWNSNSFKAVNSNYPANSALNNNGAWVFSQGGENLATRSSGVELYLVRGALTNSQISQRFIVSPDGAEVTDNFTGLTWQRCLLGMNFSGGICVGTETLFSTHESALSAAASIGNGWKIPNIKELASTISRNFSPSAIDTTEFLNTPTNAVWSSTPSVNPPGAWYVIFNAGGVVNIVGRSLTSTLGYVRLVRTGCGSNC